MKKMPVAGSVQQTQKYSVYSQIIQRKSWDKVSVIGLNESLIYGVIISACSANLTELQGRTCIKKSLMSLWELICVFTVCWLFSVQKMKTCCVLHLQIVWCDRGVVPPKGTLLSSFLNVIFKCSNNNWTALSFIIVGSLGIKLQLSAWHNDWILLNWPLNASVLLDF